MENVFFKYGMIIVGVAVIMLLIGFSMSAMTGTIKPPLESDGLVEGGSSDVMLQIEDLCSRCVRDDIDKDCYVKEIELVGTITPDMMARADIELEAELTQGRNVIKIISLDRGCVVRRLV